MHTMHMGRSCCVLLQARKILQIVWDACSAYRNCSTNMKPSPHECDRCQDASAAASARSNFSSRRLAGASRRPRSAPPLIHAFFKCQGHHAELAALSAPIFTHAGSSWIIGCACLPRAGPFHFGMALHAVQIS